MADGDKFLYTGALLYCDKGCALTPFYASAKASYLYGSFTGTSTDNMPLVNVLPFGVCLAKHGTPCLPLKLEWTKCHNGALKIGKARPLLVTSECKCSFGGTIRVFETRAAVVAALNKMPSGKDKQRLQKAYNDQVKSYNEMLKQGKILKVASIPQRKTVLEDLKETWDGIKGLSKVITATVIWDVAVLKGQDGDAAVKSAGESIGVDLDSTNKAINDFNCALDNMTTGEKAKLAGKAIVSFFDCESPGELISGVGFMKAAKTVKTVEEVKKVQTLAKEVKAIETATTKATVEGQKVVKGVMKVNSAYKTIKSPTTQFGKLKMAYKYYKTMGWNKEKIRGHLMGIDFSKPVELIQLPKGKKLWQYQLPGKGQGLYYGFYGTPQKGLGLNYHEGRILNKYITDSPTIVLKSKAKDILDWSGSGEIFPGGKTQIFTNSNINIKPNK